MAYDTAVIRELLTVALGDEDIMILCYDYLRPVYESFTAGMSRKQKIQILVEYCDRNDQFPALLFRISAINPSQYAKFEARSGIPPQPLPPAPGAPMPMRPHQPHDSKLQTRSNPFRYLRPVSPDEFVGRWPLVKEIAADLTLERGDSHGCIGGRRFGKSSLLTALHHHLRHPEMQGRDRTVLPILFDFMAWFTSELKHLYN